jgi:hypothetical protein
LTEAVDVVAVANRVEGRNQDRVAHDVADALKAQRVGLRECPRDQHVGILERERQRVVIREVHIRFVEQDHAALGAAEPIEFGARVPPAARGIGGGHECQGGIKTPQADTTKGRHRRQAVVPIERDGVATGAVRVGQHRIERVTRREVLHERAGVQPLPAPTVRFDERADRQGQALVRSVADENVGGRAAMEARQPLAERLRGRVRVQPQPVVGRLPNGRQHERRGGIGVLVRVEFDEPLDLRLFTGHVGMEPTDEWADESGR